MSTEENKPLFHFVYSTEEDYKKETQDLIKEIKEENITEYKFKGESLYRTKNYGHSFVWGFYIEYITKSGIRATEYSSRFWSIDGEDYNLEKGEFVLIPKTETKPIDFNDIQFPIVKNVGGKTIAEDLPSVKPKQN